MGIDPRFGIACLGKVNAMYESDMDLMIQFHQFVANARQVDHPICDDLVLGVPHQGAMEEGSDGDGGGGEGGGDEMATDMGSEEIEQNIQHIFEKIKHFTQQVGDLLEAGRTMFRNLSVEFEERLLSIHKEQLEKWQDEIKELQSCDASNETARALLDNAQHLLCSAHQDATYQYQATEPMLD
ncbi:hypothetical protein Cni_G09061 [Canna indica]|uniref:Uncharacterized protein n=1 Tax=Canna indica TaxID=4628 RepID=A0AAQ3K1T9_9LILI|nr:hypothetical protein Cni_G09061 [Canna indica]